MHIYDIVLLRSSINVLAYPSNIQVFTLSNTSVDVRWSTPNEFYSNIVKYR